MRDKIKKNILTGQQIGLLGGPLYTVYKVLGAVNHAEKVNGKAVFWMETNDADFNEINHIDFVDSRGNFRSLRWDIDSKGFSCGYIEVDDILIGILKEFFDSVTKTEYTEELREEVLSFYRKGDTLSKASWKLFSWLFEKFSVKLFDPFDISFRKFSKKILLKEADYTKDGDQCNLFILKDKRRMALFKKNNLYFLRDGSEINPVKFDLLPNVKTRSVCQDAWFGTDTYIAGPGEEKYLKDLGPFYKRHGVNPSKVVSRMSVDLIEPRVKKAMSKAGLTIDDVRGISVDEIKRKVLERSSGFDYRKIMERSTEKLDDFLNKLKGEGLKTESMRKEFVKILKRSVGELRRDEKEKHKLLLKRIELIYGLLRPDGKKQERVFNIFWYMNLYGGRSFLDFLFGKYDQDISVLEIKNG